MNKLNAMQILELIPHREPFIFVRDANIISEIAISGTAYWDESHPILKGHFPHQPVVPGICQVEACAQLAGVLLAWNARQSNISRNTLGVLGAIRQAKFQGLLLPGSSLNIICNLRLINQSLCLVAATGLSNEKTALTCEFVIGFRTSAIF